MGNHQYIGDGIFVNFRDFGPAGSALNAVESAIAIQKEFQEILESWENYGIKIPKHIKHMVGIATGEVYTGFVGHRQERRYKLVGPTVNLASHLCDAARATSSGILICQNTFNYLAHDDFDMKPANVEGFEDRKIYQVNLS